MKFSVLHATRKPVAKLFFTTAVISISISVSAAYRTSYTEHSTTNSYDTSTADSFCTESAVDETSFRKLTIPSGSKSTTVFVSPRNAYCTSHKNGKTTIYNFSFDMFSAEICAELNGVRWEIADICFSQLLLTKGTEFSESLYFFSPDSGELIHIADQLETGYLINDHYLLINCNMGVSPAPLSIYDFIDQNTTVLSPHATGALVEDNILYYTEAPQYFTQPENASFYLVRYSLEQMDELERLQLSEGYWSINHGTLQQSGKNQSE